MRRLCTIAILFLLTTAAPPVAMAGPPSQLYGKSVSFRWLEEIDFAHVDGQHGNAVWSHAVGSYISTSGRIFTRFGSVRIRGPGFGRPHHGIGGRPGVGSSLDPEGGEINANNPYSQTSEFRGRTLILTKVFDSGARRITVNFDERFHACTVDVVFGKERGVPGIIRHSSFGGKLLLSTYTVSDQSCTITDGNIFGDSRDNEKRWRPHDPTEEAPLGRRFAMAVGRLLVLLA
jgi:hypothetical protein